MHACMQPGRQSETAESDFYLISSTISNHHKQGPVLQSDSILYLDTNPVVYLLSNCCHRPNCDQKIQLLLKTTLAVYPQFDGDKNVAVKKYILSNNWEEAMKLTSSQTNTGTVN